VRRPRAVFTAEASPGRAVEWFNQVPLVESGDGLTLIDTAFGTQDVNEARRAGPFIRWVLNPARAVDETAAARLRALGRNPDDVKDIVLTHLDPDHAGGLADFPDARECTSLNVNCERGCPDRR